MNTFKIHNGNCIDVMKTMPDNSVDSIVTDPPYGLSFMGKKWDYDVPSVEIWEECFRVLKPGGYLLAFAGTRTQHRMAVRIEDAGFEIRDMIAWVYGSGFPKSLDISKAIDKAAGAERKVVSEVKTNSGGMAHISKTNSEHGFRPSAYHGNSEDKSAKNVIKITEPATDSTKQWEGWGTALKPALEPITVARKPISEKTIAKNVLEHGTGGINIDGCRVNFSENDDIRIGKNYTHHAKAGLENGNHKDNKSGKEVSLHNPTGRFPANIIHDGSEEVLDLFPDNNQTGKHHEKSIDDNSVDLDTFGFVDSNMTTDYPVNNGSAARFFYCAKTSKKDRNEGLENLPDKEWRHEGAAVPERNNRPFVPSKNNHPTVKPTDLMRYLVRLVTPPNGIVLDPFNGSGSTGKAAIIEGMNYIGIELDPEYIKISEARILYAIDNKNSYFEKNKKKPETHVEPNLDVHEEIFDWE
jgi:DNA modification methylase